MKTAWTLAATCVALLLGCSSSDDDGSGGSAGDGGSGASAGAGPTERELLIHLDFEDFPADCDGEKCFTRDQSGHGNDADCQEVFTRNGTDHDQCPEPVDGPHGGRAVTFSGGVVCDMSSDYFAVASHPSLDNLRTGTIALWANVTDREGSYISFIDTLVLGQVGTWNVAGNNSPDTDFGFRVEDGSGYYDSTRFTFPERLNSWDHYAITWDGATVKGYLNGDPIYEGPQGFSELILGQYIAIAANGHYSARNAPTNNCVIYYGWPAGDYVFPNHGFLQGSLDDIRMYSYALTEQEIQELQ